MMPVRFYWKDTARTFCMPAVADASPNVHYRKIEARTPKTQQASTSTAGAGTLKQLSPFWRRQQDGDAQEVINVPTAIVSGSASGRFFSQRWSNVFRRSC